MTFYEYLEEAAQEKGFKDLTEFCMQAGITVYLQERFKYNPILRSDIKAKIAKTLGTDLGFINQLISNAQKDMLTAEFKQKVVVEKLPEEPKKNKKPVIEEVVEEEEELPFVDNFEDAEEILETEEFPVPEEVEEEITEEIEEEVEEMVEEKNLVKEEKFELPEVKSAKGRREVIVRADLNFVDMNIKQFQMVGDTFYLEQAKMYIDKIIMGR